MCTYSNSYLMTKYAYKVERAIREWRDVGELVATLLQKLPKYTLYYKDCFDLKEP